MTMVSFYSHFMFISVFDHLSEDSSDTWPLWRLESALLETSSLGLEDLASKFQELGRSPWTTKISNNEPFKFEPLSQDHHVGMFRDIEPGSISEESGKMFGAVGEPVPAKRAGSSSEELEEIFSLWCWCDEQMAK